MASTASLNDAGLAVTNLPSCTFGNVANDMEVVLPSSKITSDLQIDRPETFG